MLIKEYRIPLPLTVEEYKIAQLYMIAKKSRTETKGAGSGVEILINEPYYDGPGGSGQYTRKMYHVGNHLPGWLKALVPKSALTVEEEAWNAYPYTKTRYTCPFVEKFSLEIETKYFDDPGNQDNVFDMPNSELRNRVIDVIDLVKDEFDYIREEDPKLYVSEVTKRGPLPENWVEIYSQECEGKETPLPDGKTIMCAYKLCKVEFRYWGMQTKIEKFIHETALRKTMVNAHRQAWVWQDEWVGMTMEDIRKLERETQEALAKKMNASIDVTQGNRLDEPGPSGLQNNAVRPSPSGLSGQEVDMAVIDKDNEICIGSGELNSHMSRSRSASPHRPPNKPRNLSIAHVAVDYSGETNASDVRQKHWSRSGSRTALCSPSGSSTASFDIQLANWRMESIVRDSESSSEDEFFDAEETMMEGMRMARWSSVDMIPDDEEEKRSEPESSENSEEFTSVTDSIFSSGFIKKSQADRAIHPPSITSGSGRGSLDTSLPPTPTASPAHQPCKTTVLALVLHAGSVLDSGMEASLSKKADVTTFRSAFEAVMRQHYPAMLGHLAVHLVSCPSVCADALAILSNLSPYSFQSSPSAVDTVCRSYDSIPLGALPLFAISSPEYQDALTSVITTANKTYKDFLQSEEGSGFRGQVVFIGDSVGSLMAYDALCRSGMYNSHYGSETSINEMVSASSCVPPPTPQSTRPNPLISVSDNSSGRDAEEGGPTAAPVERSGNNSRIYRKSYSHPQESEPPSSEPLTTNRLLSAPNTRRHSAASNDHSGHHKLEFEVSDLFMFGSPLGTVLAYRKMLTFDDKSSPPPRPLCNQVYNLFHPTNPMASRIEPLLSARFSQLCPINVPRYQRYPVGDGQPIHLLEYIQTYPHLFLENQASGTSNNCSYSMLGRRTSEASISSTMSGMIEMVPISTVTAITQKWWGNKRLDYALYCPEGLANFPTNALPHLFHASYWESSDVIAFVLRQLMRSDSLGIEGAVEKEKSNFIPSQPREKWLKKRTSVKLKNVTANHRANDVIVREGVPQIMNARFMYGPLDMVALTGEKVDVHIMKDMRCGEWMFIGTEVTDKNGRLSYTIPQDKSMGYGMFPIKMVVRGDHTSLDFFLSVIPPKTECIVFSIDGSFTASVSVTGRDPKVRAGAVDVVRHWQELGYLIIYITGRPDMQQRRVMSWLSQHNFPLGLVYFADGLSTDPLRHKADYLRQLQTNAEVIIHSGYGSSKDISVYNSLGLKPDQIFVVGKASKKQHNNAKILSEGYAAHLADLKTPGTCRPAQGNARMVLSHGCFGLPGQSPAISAMRQRRSAKRTTSYPLSGQNFDVRTSSPTAKTSTSSSKV